VGEDGDARVCRLIHRR
jgi:hypothetical protein